MFLLLLELVCGISLAAAVLGPISTDKPVPAGGTVSTDQPPLSSFFYGHAAPFPTNDWWVGYASGSGDDIVAGPFPYQSSLSNSTINIGMSNSRSFDGTSIIQTAQIDWKVGFSEHSGKPSDHHANSWDSQSVQVKYNGTGTIFMYGYMLPGSPYMTFKFNKATPILTSGQGKITSFAGKTVTSGGSSVSATGTSFKVVNSAGTYKIYSLSDSLTLTAKATSSSSTIKASSTFSGILRMVKINSSSHEAILDTYHATYAIGVATDYSFSGDTGLLTFTWDVAAGTASDLLMLTWPHHRKKMQSPNFPSTSSLKYLTTKGYMYPALGNTWSLKYSLVNSDMVWQAARSPDSSCTTNIENGLEYEIGLLSSNNPSVPGDFYYWGQAIANQGRLALIADHLGRSDLIPSVISYLEASFAYWFNSSSSILPAYESKWGGIIDKSGVHDVNVDFGNGYYNDHHFHYGYFLTGAAIIAKYDSTWLAAHKTYINYFFRDIVNPSTSDPYFPVTRHRDWFAGHSWASGISDGAEFRDEESTGEAVNAYYGAMLWADVIGDTDMYNYARLLLASEQAAAQVYWHLYPAYSTTQRDNPYPEAAVRDLITIGNVQEYQAGAWLWWGSEKTEIASIQILPVLPVNELL